MEVDRRTTEEVENTRCQRNGTNYGAKEQPCPCGRKRAEWCALGSAEARSKRAAK